MVLWLLAGGGERFDGMGKMAGGRACRKAVFGPWAR
jgi:ribulose 1,5-bisphosphate carboxylase large subunit-like protein